jgi:hypothetical protein
MTRSFRLTLGLLLLGGAARADEAEILIGAPPEACAAARAKSPPPGHLGPPRVGALLTWIAAHTCRQYLVPKALLTRTLQVEPTASADELERSLPTVLAAAKLGARPYEVTRIGEATAEQLASVERLASAGRKLGVRCRGDRCTVPRHTVNATLDDMVGLASQARIVPAMRDGKPIGFKLYGIRPESIYSQLGLLNGDTILAVNGEAFADPESALALYSKLRGATRLDVTLERRGAPKVIEIEIAGD